ncbi:MAG: histidine kinase [Phormidesmis sp.]
MSRPADNPSNRAIQFHNHPFRFLLYLEWGLLTLAIISTLDSPPMRAMGKPLRAGLPRSEPPGWQHSPLIAVVALVLFGLMGLYLPTKKLPKLGHTLGQILIILLPSATVLNEGRTFPFVYLVLVIRGCLMYGLTGRLVLTGTAFVLFIGGLIFRLRSLAGLGRRLPPDARDRFHAITVGFQVNFIVLFGLALLLVMLLINALMTERQSQQRLQQANQTLRQSAQEIEKLAMDQERNRIARDIHDTRGHSLTALNIQIESAAKLWEKEPQRARQFLGNAKRLGTQSLQEVRQSVATLRQDPLAGKTLEQAIAHLIKDIQANPNHQLLITHHIQIAQPLPSSLKVLLYRIVQEGMTNIVKHANATEVRLQLIGSGAIATLNLEDNGQGFNVEQAKTGFGLQSMRDRAESVGGTFVVNSTERGTRLLVNVLIVRR